MKNTGNERKTDTTSRVWAKSISREKWILSSLLLGAGIIRSVLAFHHAGSGLFDDAYASLRYASNIVQGFGFVFNPGERVLGTTSPLFAVILAAVSKIVGVTHLEAIDLTIGVVASLGMLYYSERFLTLVGIAAEVKWTYVSVLAFLPSFLANSSSGMETPLVLLLMSLSLYLAIQDRLMAVAVVGVLLFLSRIDTGIWLLALGVHILLERRGRPMRDLALPLATFLGGVVGWLAYTKFYFGSIVPESVVGKALSHGAFERPDWHYALTLFSGLIPAQRFGAWGFAVIAIAVVLLLPTTADLWRRYHGLRPMIYFCPLYMVFFLASRAPLFSWYLIPPKWAFYLLAVYFIWRWIVPALQISPVPLQPASAMAIVGLFVFGLAINDLRSELKPPSVNTWLSISNLIEQNVRPEGRVFLEHIGLISFRTGRYIYDYGGLVTPQTNILKRQYGRGWVTKALRQYQADVVILYDNDKPLIESPTDPDAVWFRDAYKHVKDYQTPEVAIEIFFLKSSPRIISSQSPNLSESPSNPN